MTTPACAETFEVHVVYGLGSSCTAQLAAENARGRSARELIREVISRPRAQGPAQRTAKVLGDVLQENREMDVELFSGAAPGAALGDPITLDHVVIPSDGTASPTRSGETFTIQVSESYRGG